MKKLVILAVAALAMASCSKNKFHVEGQINNAKDSVLYFENIGLSGYDVLDSVKLGDDGSFSFSGEAQEAPEFYRLRISDQIISLAIDSTETVTVKGQWPQMASQYEVSGSDECQTIKELALKQMDLQQRAILVSRNQGLTVDQVNDSILSMIRSYKDEVKRKYIFPAPNKSSAYFALFQTLGNMLLFNPQTDKDDIKVFAAVATSWDTYWPEAERGRNLHNIAIEGMKNVRINEAQANRTIDASKVQETGLIDIALRDNKGQMRHLTDLKGKVVLLDFHVFATNDSPARILLLRELYNKYHGQGLEIYQVSLDADEHFWKQQTAALPWISVREDKGISSSMLAVYNVQAVPEFFLIDRGNNLIGRSQTIKDLDQAIKSLL
ncbi:MAG: AhpC/TSA family protein [Prevotella sp.]|nr:AhpC/TSA family protein [Prevotella sp.]